MKTRLSTTWTLVLVSGVIITSMLQEAGAQTPTNSSPVVPDERAASRRVSRAADTEASGLAERPNARFSFWTGEIAKLAQAGIDDNIVLLFIDNVGTFNLSADQIISLTDLGVSREVIAGMLQHDFEIASGLRPMPAVLPMSEPAIHITFTSNKEVLEKAVGNTAATPAVADSTRIVLPKFNPIHPEPSVWDSAMEEAASQVSWGTPTPVEESRYAVREPYPVKLTDPIVIIRAPGRTPNLVLIHLDP